MSSNGGDQDREAYEAEQAFRTLVVARELKRRVGMAPQGESGSRPEVWAVRIQGIGQLKRQSWASL